MRFCTAHECAERATAPQAHRSSEGTKRTATKRGTARTPSTQRVSFIQPGANQFGEAGIMHSLNRSIVTAIGLLLTVGSISAVGGSGMMITINDAACKSG